jgi:3-oxoadipate enol-lactonase
VLVHSLGTDLSLWNDVAPTLVAHHRILRCDLRGHGASSAAPGPYTIADLSHDLLELLDALNVDRCDFCGLSIGGQIAMWLGAVVPGRFNKLIMANTAARIGTVEGWNERIARVRDEGLEEIADAAMNRWFTAPFQLKSPVRVAEMRNVLTATPLEGYTGCCAALRDSDLHASLSLIEAPVLVISSAHDPVIATDDGRDLAARISRAEYVELNAGHISAIEQSGAFSSAAGAFLNGKEIQHG